MRMMQHFFVAILLFGSLVLNSTVSRADLSKTISTTIQEAIEKKIAETIPHSSVQVSQLDKVVSETSLSEITELKEIRLIEEKATGMAIVEVTGFDKNKNLVSQMLQTPFRAWVKVPVAVRRIYPLSKLKTEDFKIQTVDVATGKAREFRGVLASENTQLDRMESRQTILEGQFLITSAFQKQPDLKKGDLVKIELSSGELVLSTQGILQESGSIGDRVRVITSKTKKEVIGKINAEQSIEVRL